jgi:stage II sporulation protein D
MTSVGSTKTLSASLLEAQREEIETSWQQAKNLFPPRTSIAPEIVFAPSAELFRQMTSQPGWMLASTRGSRIVLNAKPALDSNEQKTLRHEMLHVVVESEASAKAPLWLREGLVEVLDGEAAGSGMSGAAMEAELSRPTTREASERAHRAAAAKVRTMVERYGMAQVRSWLVAGVPVGAN